MGLFVLVPVSIALWLLCLLIPRTTANRDIPWNVESAVKGVTSFLCGVKANDTDDDDDEDGKVKTAGVKPAWSSKVVTGRVRNIANRTNTWTEQVPLRHTPRIKHSHTCASDSPPEEQ